MNKKYLTLWFLFLSNFIFSQDKDCNCLDELENTSKLIENAKSYKVQIRGGNREKDFKNWKEEIKGEIANDTLSNFFVLVIFKSIFPLSRIGITKFILSR